MAATDYLLPYENPLGKRFGPEFFSTIPRAPGVYFMLGENRSLLYVGKAKDLRARLLSYKRARPDQVSRKVIRMIRMITEIQWEECESEDAALLRENELLRTQKPPFNVANTEPESYYFIGASFRGRWLDLELTCNPNAECDLLFGAYKGRGTVRRGYHALLRLLWSAHAPDRDPGDEKATRESWRFDIPSVLTRYKPPYKYTLELKNGLDEAELRLWRALIRRFLRGTSRALIPKLVERLLEMPEIPRFMYNVFQDDIDALREFYQRGPNRNRRMSRKLGRAGHLIAQEEIDDLLVLYKSVQKGA